MDAKLVKELRAKSGAGMMDCKKALVETDGNIEDAMVFFERKRTGSNQQKGGSCCR